jgi:hypothetical protein
MADRQSEKPTGNPPEPGKGPHHIADDAPPEPTPEQPKIQPAVTETGLPVEDQIEKEWDPNRDGGLPSLFPGER